MTAITITFPHQNTILSYLESHPTTDYFYQFHNPLITKLAEIFAETTETPENIKEAVIWVTQKYNSRRNEDDSRRWSEDDSRFVINTIFTALVEAYAKPNCQTRAEAACSSGKPRIISKL